MAIDLDNLRARYRASGVPEFLLEDFVASHVEADAAAEALRTLARIVAEAAQGAGGRPTDV